MGNNTGGGGNVDNEAYMDGFEESREHIDEVKRTLGPI